MINLAIVPARGGSKRLRNKNFVELGGKPLIYHTLDVLADVFDKIIVASDCATTLGIAERHSSKPKTVDLPASTTSDTSTVLDSTCWLLDKGHIPCGYDIVGLFLATCPLRTEDDINEGLSMMEGVDGVISTTDYQFPPTLGLVKDQDGLLHCSDSNLPWLTGNTRSQDHSSVIRPNGALYLKWVEAFHRDRNFYKGRIRGYHMPRSRSADIDTIDDLEAIEQRLRKE